MSLLLQPRDAAEQYTVVKGDTLSSIAAAKCPVLGWKVLARYNFGTDDPKEVQRALCETVGVKVASLPKQGEEAKPQDLPLQPDAELAPKLRVPKAWTQGGLAMEKTHKINVKPVLPANAVSLTALDKWFIPDHEKCELKYALQGLAESADKLVLDVYASNYCDASAWNKGLGTYTAPSAMIDIHLHRVDLAAQAAERTAYDALPGDGWKGEVTTTHGMLGRKTGTATKRFVNVAFSPYTAHFRYHKADGDKTAHVVLEPFWPLWEEFSAKPPPGQAPDGGNIKVSWRNAAKADRGLLEVYDAEGQRVHLAELTAAQLEAGDKDTLWDKAYREDVFNGKFQRSFIDESGMTTAQKRDELLFKSTPYVYRVTTFTRKPKNDSLKIKWEVRHTSKLEEGMLEIVDGKDKLVFQKPLAKAKLASGKQEFQWDGKYAEGLKNSKDGTEIIPDDMPYRVRLQAHTQVNTAEALAIAVMHTEVRIRVDKSVRAPRDPLYDPWNAKPGMRLTQAPWVAGDPPTAGTEFNRLKLAEFGFHPGPIRAGGAASTEFQTALREFKRSVPADGGAAAPNFVRQNLAGGDDVAENAELTTAINSMRGGDKRRMYGDPARISANSNAPDLSDEEIKQQLGDPSKDVVVWVDDRQYYTASPATKDENDDNFMSGSPVRESFDLLNYRGGMSVADNRAALDEAAIARPWLPMKVELALLGRTEPLVPDHDKAKVVIDDDALRAKMNAAIGPLRVDWSFDELPPDLSVVTPGSYDHTLMRARKDLAWLLFDKKETADREDTGRTHTYYNCPQADGGLRPAGAAGYYEKAFGTNDLKLEPWEAKPVAATETVATVVHDHICAKQVAKTDLFEPLIGAAGAYFRPSRVAGDGYRVRAAVSFDEFEGYKFPNLAALKGRYPVPPATASARLRVWRRASIRGYLCWSNPDSGHWPGFIDEFRAHYRAGHVYMVHEGGAATRFQVSDFFNPATPAHVTMYKNILSNNMSKAALKDKAKMSLKADFIWPWSDRADFGYPFVSAVDLPDADVFQTFLSDQIMESTWGLFSRGLLFAILKQIEKRGAMRGHLLAEFKSSNDFHLREYRCNRRPSRGASHRYWACEKGPSTNAARLNNVNCPSPNCYSSSSTAAPPLTQSKLTATGRFMQYNDMPLWAEGNALGVTWLFTTSDAGTWVHEVAHHRHFEHAASAPGATPALHDTDNNEVNWPSPHAHTVDEKWDRDCLMSYTEGERLYFCGKCLLRNRGWMVAGAGQPGAKVREPT